MTEVSASRLVSYQFKEPPRIGRAEEFSRLTRIFSNAKDGKASLTFIEAPSGVGKSKLINDFSVIVCNQGALLGKAVGVVLSGRQPFHVVRSIVQQILGQMSGDETMRELVRQKLKAYQGILVTAIPEFKVLLGDSTSQEREQAFVGEELTIRALAEFLNAIGAGERSAFVIFEDCQWLDEGTIKVLRHWREHLSPDCKTAVIASFRSDEIASDHILRTISPHHQLRLAALTEAEVVTLISEVAGDVQDAIRRLVLQLAGGNPFMVLTVLRGLVESEQMIHTPHGWALVSNEMSSSVNAKDRSDIFLRKRFEILSPTMRRLLQQAAVLGKEFDLTFLQALWNGDADTFAKLITSAEDRYILVDAALGRKAFAHDKLREVLLEMIPPFERKTLHLQIARLLVTLRGEDAFDISFHFSQAEDFESALPFALQAAKTASARHSLVVAAEQYRIALKGLDSVSPSVQWEIRSGLGRTLISLGEYRESEEHFLAALELTDDQMKSAIVYERLGELKTYSSDPKNGLLYIERGLALLGEKVSTSLPTIIAKSLYQIVIQAAHCLLPRSLVGNKVPQDPEKEFLIHRFYMRYQYFAYFECKVADIMPVHLESMNRLEKFAMSRELAHIYAVHATFCAVAPWVKRSLLYVDNALMISRDLNDIWLQGFSHFIRGVTLYVATRFREALTAHIQGENLLERAGDRWESHMAGCNIAYCLYRLGSLEAACEKGKAVVEVGLGIGNYVPAASALSCWSKASGGNIPDNIMLAALARTTELDIQSSVEIKQAGAIWHLHHGRYEEAVHMLRDAWSQFRKKHISQEYVISTLPWLVTALRMLMEQTTNASQVKALEKEAWRVTRRTIWLMQRFRGNLPHIYREAGILSARSPKGVSRSKKYFEKSLAEAARQQGIYEQAQTRLAIGTAGMRYGWDGASETHSRAREELVQLRAPLSFHGIKEQLS